MLRLILISNGWPVTNSDEATMGLQALHILMQGERPIFFYGQNYMGSLEAYVAAYFFWLLGPSTFALRLGLLGMYAGFLLAQYLLARLLYSKGVALTTLFLLCWGSQATLYEQLVAAGGRLEPPLFGTLSLLLTSWLALSFHTDTTFKERQRRLLAYGCLGVVIGVGLWIDLLILPFVCTSLVLLLLFCHRELCTRAFFFGILGFLIGAFPLLLFNIEHPQDNSILTLWQQYRSTGMPLPTGENLGTSILATILISIPTATGANPLCLVSEPSPWLHGPPLSCMGFQTSWGLCAVIIWALAVFVVCKELPELCRVLATSRSSAEKGHLIRCASQLALLASVGLTALSYATSPSAALFPDTASRYLVGFLVATPAVVAGLWPKCSLGKVALIRSLCMWTIVSILVITGYFILVVMITLAVVTLMWPKLWLSLSEAVLARLRTTGALKKIGDSIKIGILCFISTVLILGMVSTFCQIPETQKLTQRQNTLINSLLYLHARHIYSDYWTCNRLIFLSNERIICSVLSAGLSPGLNRYQPYAQIVAQDHRAAYVFDTENGGVGGYQSMVFAQYFGTQYRAFYLAGFVVRLPDS
jgi:hypothetical protein